MFDREAACQYLIICAVTFEADQINLALTSSYHAAQ